MTACNICGSNEFERGPGGRLSLNGALPLCRRCRSLERHRAVRRAWDGLDPSRLAGRRALVLNGDLAVPRQLFADVVDRRLVPGEEFSLAVDDGSVDVVIANYVLQFAPSEAAAVRELFRVLAPDGVIQLSVPNPLNRRETEESATGSRIYGADVVDRLGSLAEGAFLQRVESRDPVTGMRELILVWGRSRQAVEGWRPMAEEHSNGSVSCVVCGGTEFQEGPFQRLSRTGRKPCCRSCGSLERHRLIRQLWKRLPASFLEGRRAIQFSLDPSIDGNWFGSLEVSIYEARNSIDLQAIERDDGSYDTVICNHVLEHVPDDLQAFRELIRVLSPRGFLQMTVPNPVLRSSTEDWGYPKPEEHMHYRVYGSDLVQRFLQARPGTPVLVIPSTDDVTGVSDLVYFWARERSVLAEIEGYLA